MGETRERVKEYAEKGLNPSEIGRVLGISREAARQHMARLRADGDLPKESVA